ncbi:MAG: hypothetical protein E6L08_10505 [Verrucomicrobia bacterium]|nr:MAG: hypothetical protein E6L08_10505 [Verrucomicrobiota bacterium]
MRADIKVWFDHPDIHPEDARNAFLAWFRRTSKDRRKPPHMILEKALIASALNDTQDKQVLPPAWKDREGNVIVVPSDGFETRWQRARKDGREPIFDKIDDFILRTWRVMRPLGEFRWEPNVPGLIEWSPRAASALIRALPIGVTAGDETWYVKKRNRLGLQGKRRYRVHDFGVYKDGLARIDID